MWLMKYDGTWIDSEARNPESLVSLAPPNLQDACVRHGGTRGWTGEPNFRLVRVDSRYQISGGQNITFKDAHGNVQAIKELQEVLIPRYHVPPNCHSRFALEMWHPAKWFYENGYEGLNATEFDENGKGFVNMEPIWPDGGWEAIWNGIQWPLMLQDKINSPIGDPLVEQAIRAVRERMATTAENLIAARKAQKEEKDRQEKAERLEMIRDRRSNLFIEPAVSFAGVDGVQGGV